MVGILVSFSFPIYTKYIKENRINEAKAVLLEYLNYLQEYYYDNNNYKDSNGNDISLNNEDVNKLSKYFNFVVKFDDVRQDKFILKAIPKEEYSQKESRYLTVNQYGNIFICMNINNHPKCE